MGAADGSTLYIVQKCPMCSVGVERYVRIAGKTRIGGKYAWHMKETHGIEPEELELLETTWLMKVIKKHLEGLT